MEIALALVAALLFALGTVFALPLGVRLTGQKVRRIDIGAAFLVTAALVAFLTFSILVCGIVGGTVAALVPLSVLGELISIGTLLAFIIVSCGVVTLRRRYPDLERPFRVPALPLVAGAAIPSSLALMATLPGATWIRLAVWALLGFCVYFFYARGNSACVLREHAEAPAPSLAEVGL